MVEYMASALVNNVGISPEGFLDCPPAYGWLSPRISFSRDLPDEPKPSSPKQKPVPEDAAKDLVDFEFRLHDPVTMLPADELFSDGKLVPLQLRPSVADSSAAENRSLEAAKPRRRVEIAVSEAYALSPKAPRCSSRWRELLGLKKLQNSKSEPQKQSPAPGKISNARSLKHLLHKNHRSSATDSSSLSLPLLRDSDSESVSISSSRLFLSSSSSSGPDHEDLPRLSLDSEKPCHSSISVKRNPPRVRLSRPRSEINPTVSRMVRSPIRRAETAVPLPSGASVDSPRMNASGRVVFQGLERSSSSPGSFNGGPRAKHRGVERSYSANVVRVSPVLNVPVCSLRGSSSKSVSVLGFGQLFSPQKKDREGSATRTNTSKPKTERF
ncbi:hypothetical protein J5N97_017735 [Dioscorea zingiberensis]|uniref:Uncharacterized protein n=1 Tax=Dioscorea zingiberensis TaxID=325984 RepID=A0A9D5CM62_9LILI|nr:hypothetical protein J5N97_017735 [Dioscorea zingiberensis]